ncbi:hypothetical protein TNCV_3099151 [Trichonephila clavipes]|nr:hypothetical protein TNCV_3099151 [Trichonephila clavipes]
MSARADFKKMEVGKTFGTGLPTPSEGPPRLKFAQKSGQTQQPYLRKEKILIRAARVPPSSLHFPPTSQVVEFY